MNKVKQELREIKREIAEWNDDGYPITSESLDDAMRFVTDKPTVCVAEDGGIYLTYILPKHIFTVCFDSDGGVTPTLVKK